MTVNTADVNCKLVNAPAQYTAVIALGAHLSAPIQSCGNTFFGMSIHSSFTAGNLFFMGSIDNNGEPGDWSMLTDGDGDILSIAESVITTDIAAIISPATRIQFPLEPILFAGCDWLMVYCASAQAAAQSIRFSMGPVLGS